MELDAKHPAILLDLVLKSLRLSICATRNWSYGFFQGIMTLAKNFYWMKNSPLSPFFNLKITPFFFKTNCKFAPNTLFLKLQLVSGKSYKIRHSTRAPRHL